MTDERQLNSWLTGRAEISATIVAIVFGIFSILSLLQETKLPSFAWNVLTLVYFLLLIAIFFAFRNWLSHFVKVEKHLRKTTEEPATETPKKKGILQKIFSEYPSGFEPAVQLLIIGPLFLIVPVAILLWYAVAFHCGVGSLEPSTMCPK